MSESVWTKIKTRYGQFWNEIPNRNGLIYTAEMFTNSFITKIFLSQLASFTVDLSKIYEVKIAEMALFSIVFQLGTVLSIITNTLANRMNRQLCWTMVKLLFSLNMFGFIFYRPRPLVYVGFFFNGFFRGNLIVFYQDWLWEIWPNAYTIILLISDLFSGIAWIIGPLIAEKYVFGNVPMDKTKRLHSVMIPFICIGLIAFISGLINLCLYIFKPYKKPEQTIAKMDSVKIIRERSHSTMSQNLNITEDEMTKLKSNEQLNNNQTFTLIFSSIYFALYCGFENIICDQQATSFQLGIPNMTAIDVNSQQAIVQVFNELGLFITAIISSSINAEWIIFLQYILIYLGFSAIYMGQDRISILNIGAYIIGYGTSSMYSLNFSFIRKYIKKPHKTSIIFIACNNTLIIILKIIIYLYPLDHYDYILYEITGPCLIMASTLFIILLFYLKNWFPFNSSCNKREQEVE